MWRPQAYFALAAILLGAILWSSKHLVPDILRTDFVAGCLVIASAVCLVGTAYFSLRASLKENGYHALNFVLLGSLFVTMGLLIRYQITAAQGLTKFIYTPYRHENFYIHSISERALSGETEEERRRMARAAFRVYGLTVAYKDKAGNLAFYTPDENDQRESTSLRESAVKAEEGVKMVEASLKRHPDNVMTIVWVIGGIFLFLFGLDILWIRFLRR